MKKITSLLLIIGLLFGCASKAEVGFVAYSSLSASGVEVVLTRGDGLCSVPTFHFSNRGVRGSFFLHDVPLGAGRRARD